MTVQVVKTKAETAFAEEFQRLEGSLPGSDRVRRQRRDAIGRFAALGLPHRRVEEWKYTDLRALTKDALPPGRSVESKALVAAYAKDLASVAAATFVFVDGRLVSSPEATVAGVSVESLASASETTPSLLSEDLPETADAGLKSIVALNTAFATDGAVVRIAAGAKPERPLHLVFVATGNAAVRNAVVAGAGSEATVIESHRSAGTSARFENTQTMVTLEDGARLHHVSLAEAAHGSTLVGNTVAQLGKNAVYRPFQLTTGDGLARQQMMVTFAGEHASFEFSAVALGAGSGHADSTLVVDHAVPHCTSRELFKAVLAGESKGVFQGKVIVRPGAQKTDGKQMAQALMLSPNAEFDSKPELEIYADDVICGHGSTAAELDEDLLFYCRSRGIPLAEARALLIESFIGEAIDTVENERLRAALMDQANAWLRSSAATGAE